VRFVIKEEREEERTYQERAAVVYMFVAPLTVSWDGGGLHVPDSLLQSNINLYNTPRGNLPGGLN